LPVLKIIAKFKNTVTFSPATSNTLKNLDLR